MPSLNLSRRKFLHTSAAAMATSFLSANGLNMAFNAPSYRVGLIGTGWYGKSDLFRLLQVAPVEVIALCDVDQKQLEAAAVMVQKRQKSGKTPNLYRHYRQMLANEKLDIVLIGTPDHWHALQAIDAIRAGAHVYLQKPISVDVLEGEAILKVARDENKVVQIGTQRRSTPHLMDAKSQIVDKGLLGKISHVEMCCYYHMRANDQRSTQSIPDFFDYGLWTGPAPMLPFRGLPHRRWWRAYMEYSNGIMGDMCVHMLDTVRWMLGLGWPNRITSTGGIFIQKDSFANTTDTQTAIFEYDELNCIWEHRSWGTASDPEYPWGFKIYGDKGTLKGSVYKYEFIPTDKKETPIMKEVLLEQEAFPEDSNEPNIEIHAAPATRRHMQDFISAIETGHKPVADILEGHISTASCLLANLALQVNSPLIYDPAKRKITNHKAANRLLQRPYRKPWIHPAKTYL